MDPKRGRTQTILAGSEAPGNCFAACVATVLDIAIEQVPNFVDVPDNESWWRGFERWCAPRGWLPVLMESAWVCGAFNCLCIAHGDGPRGRRHAVVWRDDAMVFDPHPSRAGLAGGPDKFVLFVALDAGARAPRSSQ